MPSAVLSGRERPGRYWKIDLDTLELPTRADGGDVEISAPSARGLIACTLAQAERDHAELLARVLGKTGAQTTKFGALTAENRGLGAFVYIPADVSVDDPILITYRASAACYPYTVVLAERGARATVIERIEGAAGATVCGIVEVVTEAHADVTVATVQNLPEDARVFATRDAKPGEGAHVSWAIADLGAALVVGSADVRIEHEGANVDISALFFPRGTQHVDLITSIDHLAPNASSETVVKSAATGRGQARYLGNIRIVKDAQGSLANLRDDALLLSKTAHIDSIPALEIAANDVKAYHGATVGAIDAELLFYMESRGIAREAAERMIALGFFEPAIARFPTEILREEIREGLRAKIV